MPVVRATVNSAVPMHAAATITVASQIGIDRHRIITIPTAMPTPNARNFHFKPGDGAGYETCWFTQKRNTGDNTVPGGHRKRGIISARSAPQAITTTA
jgi:hypothetical protein